MISLIDWIMLFLVLWALDILSPPWPTSEILIVIPLKLLGIPLLYAEAISLGIGITIMAVATMMYGSMIWLPLLASLQFFISSAFMIGLTIAMGISFVVIAIYLNGRK